MEQSNNEIWYTTTDDTVLTLYNSNLFEDVDGVALSVDNSYSGGNGIISLGGDLVKIGDSSVNIYAAFTGIFGKQTQSSSGLTRYYSNMKSISLPSSLTYIGKSCFIYCNKLESIKYNGTVEQWNAVTKATNWHYTVPSTTVVTCTDGTVALN